MEGQDANGGDATPMKKKLSSEIAVVGGEPAADPSATQMMEEYLRRTTPQALLEHMKLYGSFDQLRSALTKELVDSGVQQRLQERARATVESTRAFVHAPPFDPAMPTAKRLQHRKAVLSRVLDELHRTPLNREIEKGIQGVVQDPTSAFYELAHTQINEALESMRSSAGKRKESASLVRESSLNLPAPAASVVDGTPSQLLDEMLGAGRRKIEVKPSESDVLAAAAKRKRSDEGAEEHDSSVAQNRAKAEPKDEGAATRQPDEERDAKRQKVELPDDADKQGNKRDTGKSGADEDEPSESESDSESSEEEESASSASSSQPSSPAAGPSRKVDDDEDESSSSDEAEDSSKEDEDVDVEKDENSEEESRKKRGGGRKAIRKIQKASSSSSSSSDDGDDDGDEEKDNDSDDDDVEEEAEKNDGAAMRRRASLSSRRRREPEVSTKPRPIRKAKRRNRNKDAPRTTEEEDAALARRLAEEESARLYPLRRRASRGSR